MVTKNEMVAILAALTTDFDKASKPRDEFEHDTEAHKDAYMVPRDAQNEHRKRAHRA